MAISPTRPLLPDRPRFVLVNDVVTHGATFLARVLEAFPRSAVACFAVLRAMSGVELDAIIDPVRAGS